MLGKAIPGRRRPLGAEQRPIAMMVVPSPTYLVLSGPNHAQPPKKAKNRGDPLSTERSQISPTDQSVRLRVHPRVLRSLSRALVLGAIFCLCLPAVVDG